MTIQSAASDSQTRKIKDLDVGDTVTFLGDTGTVLSVSHKRKSSIVRIKFGNTIAAFAFEPDGYVTVPTRNASAATDGGAT